MTTPTDANIESVLRDMTAASDQRTSLWRAALKHAPARAGSRRRLAWLAAIAQRPLASAAVLIVGVGAIFGIGTVTRHTLTSPTPRAQFPDAFQWRTSESLATAKRQVNSMVGQDFLGIDPRSNAAWQAIRRADVTHKSLICPSTTATDMSRYARFQYDESVRDAVNAAPVTLDGFRNDQDAYDSDSADLRGLGQGMYVYESADSPGKADAIRATTFDELRLAADSPPNADASAADASTFGERQVVRRATIEIKTHDVRAVFLKAQYLIKPTRGEYIQDSGIRGEGDKATAELTIRVDANRLSAFLNEMRALGDVQSEVLTGDDVTTQIVDLEARLRNEQRVEAELLELLESRKDAKLDEILKLRQSLGEIRARIETMTGQREQYRRLVSLATVLILIRAGDAVQTAPESHWQAFTQLMSSSWHTGVAYLGEVVAFLVRALVGGLIFWIALAGVLIYLRRKLVRRNAE